MRRTFLWMVLLIQTALADRHEHSSSTVQHNGRMNITYSYDTVNYLESLHLIPAIKNVTCSLNHIHLHVTDGGKSLLNLAKYSILSGGLIHVCSDEEGGGSRPFYRRLESVELESEGVVLIHTTPATLTHCFREAMIQLRWEPFEKMAGTTEELDSQRGRRLLSLSSQQQGFGERASLDQNYAHRLSGSGSGTNMAGELIDALHDDNSLPWHFNHSKSGLWPKAFVSNSRGVKHSLSTTRSKGISIDCIGCKAEMGAGFIFTFHVVSSSEAPAVTVELLRSVLHGDMSLDLGIELRTDLALTKEITFDKEILGTQVFERLDIMAGPVHMSIQPTTSLRIRGKIQTSSAGTLSLGLGYKTADIHLSQQFRSNVNRMVSSLCVF